MAERRLLVEGLKPAAPSVDAAKERQFVYQASAPAATTDTPQPPQHQEPPTPKAVAAPTLARSPFTTRIRSDFAAALKRASLERQLAGVEPSTLQDIFETAIEPWLRENGYLP